MSDVVPPKRRAVAPRAMPHSATAIRPTVAEAAPGAARARDPEHLSGATRELVLVAVVLIGASRFLDGPLIWLVVAIVAAALALGSLQLMGDAHPAGESTGIPIEALVLPTVAAIAGIGIIRLVPIGIGLVPALLVAGYAIHHAVATEMRILLAPHGATPGDRTSVLVQTLVLGFAGFAGAAALVPGGLPDITGLAPGGGGSDAGTAGLSELDLATLVAADAVIAGLLGFRATALRVATVRDVLLSALTYAAVIGIAAAGFRAMEIPRLLGPGLLTIVLYLWDTIHGAPRSRRRDARRIWEAVLLAVLGILVIVWTLALRS